MRLRVSNAQNAEQAAVVAPLSYSTLATASISAIVSANVTVLKDVLRAAPSSTPPSVLPTTREGCLTAVLALRDTVLSETRSGSVRLLEDSRAMEKIVAISSNELIALGNSAPDHLLSLMQAALRHDPSLVPSLPEGSDAPSAATVAISWKLAATEEALERVRVQDQQNGGHTEIRPPTQSEVDEAGAESILDRLHNGIAGVRMGVPVAAADEPPPKRQRLSCHLCPGSIFLALSKHLHIPLFAIHETPRGRYMRMR